MYEGIELLRALCAADGPSGFEDAVRNAIEQEIKDCCDTYSCDVLGSLTAVIRGSGRGRVMLSAHMDEVGFMITDITPSGFLKFGALGGIDDAVLCGKRVQILRENAPSLSGVILSKPIHLQSAEEREAYAKKRTCIFPSARTAAKKHKHCAASATLLCSTRNLQRSAKQIGSSKAKRSTTGWAAR